MLYLDYSRKKGEWLPNRHGGNENLEAVAFLRRLNETVYAQHPGAITIAEESTAWPAVSQPTFAGGLGFGFKWNMGWMHDTLEYLAQEPVHRRWHHDRMTFGLVYAFAENFILPLSHDEVVHGKRSLLGRIPGDAWQQFATLRAYLRGHVGASRARSFCSWGRSSRRAASGISTPVSTGGSLAIAWHRGVQSLVRDCNRDYRAEPRAARARLRAPRASGGSSSTTPTTPSSRGCASRSTARGRWRSSRTSRRCRAPPTGSDCRCPAAGARSSIPTARRTADRTAATRAPSTPFAGEWDGLPCSRRSHAAAARNPLAGARRGRMIVLPA